MWLPTFVTSFKFLSQAHFTCFVFRWDPAPVHECWGAGQCHGPPVTACHGTSGASHRGLQVHHSSGWRGSSVKGWVCTVLPAAAKWIPACRHPQGITWWCGAPALLQWHNRATQGGETVPPQPGCEPAATETPRHLAAHPHHRWGITGRKRGCMHSRLGLYMEVRLHTFRTRHGDSSTYSRLLDKRTCASCLLGFSTRWRKA